MNRILLLALIGLSGCATYKGQVVFNYGDETGYQKKSISGNLKVKGADLGKLKTLLETLKLTIKD